jgi:hypothetical protein
MKNIIIAITLLVSACALAPKPPLEYLPGAVLETLSADVSLSVTSEDHGMGANGLLLYRRPDQMRMVILSPFGTTLMDVFVSGDRITIINRSQGEAYSGLVDDLPAGVEGDTWRLVRWVLEIDPPDGAVRDGGLLRRNRQGVWERVEFKNGLVVEKSLPGGDELRYNDYVVVNGVPLASEIIMVNRAGVRFRVKINEPEVNTELDPDAFTPRLDGLKLLPLSALKGS